MRRNVIAAVAVAAALTFGATACSGDDTGTASDDPAAAPTEVTSSAPAMADGVFGLTYHVIGEKLAPADLAGEHETLQGDTVNVTGSGESFTVNGDANVVCGNIQTSNGTVYLIDSVLMPPAA